MRSVEVIIHENGSITVKYQGFLGKACLEEANKIYARLKDLGVDADIQSIKETEEMRQVETQRTKLYNHQ
jgi:hypothetical protein